MGGDMVVGGDKRHIFHIVLLVHITHEGLVTNSGSIGRDSIQKIFT